MRWIWGVSSKGVHCKPSERRHYEQGKEDQPQTHTPTHNYCRVKKGAKCFSNKSNHTHSRRSINQSNNQSVCQSMHITWVMVTVKHGWVHNHTVMRCTLEMVLNNYPTPTPTQDTYPKVLWLRSKTKTLRSACNIGLLLFLMEWQDLKGPKWNSLNYAK